MLVGALQRHRILLIADHRNNLRLNLPCLDGINEGLQIGATAGSQDSDAKRRRPLS